MIDDQTYVAQLAEALDETEAVPLAVLGRFVKYCGQRLAQRLLHKTEQIERSGGQYWDNGTKRRTKGGVFFQLARTAAMGTDHYSSIFHSDPNAQPSSPPVRKLKPARPE